MPTRRSFLRRLTLAPAAPPPCCRVLKPVLWGAAWSLLLGGKSLTADAEGSAGGIAIGDYTGPRVTLLAIDDYSLPLRKDLCYYLSTPAVRAEPVLTPSRDNPHATDTMSVDCYATVLHEEGKFRMWYATEGRKENPEHKSDEKSTLHQGLCYAESPDGLHWTKPKLGQVNHRGGNDNNAIRLPATESEDAFAMADASCALVIRDDDDPDRSRRYKMVYESTYGMGSMPTAETAVSPDGITWKDTGTAAGLLEPSSFYKFNGLYTINAQNLAFVGEGGHRAGRQGYVWVSPDFDHWRPEAGESFLLPEPADPNDRGYDRPYLQVHLGVGAVSYGNALIGLYCPWRARPNPGDWFGYGTTYGDFGLVVSNDGQHFREVVKGHIFLHRHQSRAAISPDIRSEEILTQSGNSILNVGDETWIYHGRWMNTEKPEDLYGEIALATLPRDRWGALGLYPHASEGSVWTAPMVLGSAGCTVSLNAQGVQGISVEIADEKFRLIPEYSGKNAGAIAAIDGLDCSVAWPQAILDSLVGRRVRLLIHLQKGEHAEPRLFAAYILCNNGK